MKRLVCLLLLVAALRADDKNPIRWALQAKPGKVELTARIDPGWHLYSLSQDPKGPRPTLIEVRDGFRLAGKIQTPAPSVELDPTLDVEVSYYEDEVTFAIPVVRARSDAKSARIAVTFQTCNAQRCLPPRTIELTADGNLIY